MRWRHLFFSFDGRINRAKYWLVVALNLMALILALAVMRFLAVSDESAWVLVLPAIVVILTVYVGIAAGVKRLHDRDKSGWWLLIFYLLPGLLQGLAGVESLSPLLVLNLIGLAISIWALIELGFLRGTRGANAYGVDPLEGSA